MKKFILINRFILGTGSVLALTPSIFISFQNNPEWLNEAIYQSTAWILFSIIAITLLTELFYRFFKSFYLAITLLSATFAAVASACLYVNGATFFGSNDAKFDTWHLLPLFTAMHQAEATISLTVIAAAACILIASGKALIRRKA